MEKKSKDVMIGDHVCWDSSGGRAYGKIVRRVSDGNLEIPGTDFTLNGTEDNPAYLMRVHQRNKDGEYIETNAYAGNRASALSRAPLPENMKDINIDIDDDDDNDEENEDQEENAQYQNDRRDFESTNSTDTEASGVINKGDYVRFKVGSRDYRGRVIDVINDGEAVSSAGTKVQGSEEDPAVLIRLYNENEDGTYEESDMKVANRLSSLTKTPKLGMSTIPQDENMESSKKPIQKDPREKKSIQKETKTFSFDITETKEVTIDGQKYGIVKGYASTYNNVDRGNDKVLSGAFNKSLDRYRQSSRPIKMYFNHDGNEIIGGFPIDKIKNDPNGLYVEGQINLDVQKGREAYALAKQGVMQDFSIGYTVDDFDMKNGVRELKDLELWEISMVGEPMNPEARIMSVKSVTPYQDLPLAPNMDYEWDSEAAIARVKKFTKSTNAPSKTYPRAFMWFDEENKDNFTAYKLPYADIIDGRMYAIPSALSAIKAAINGGRGGVDIPAKDKATILNIIEKYEAKMVSKYVQPVDPNEILIYASANIEHKQYQYDDVANITNKRDFEKLLRESGKFSKKAAIYLSSYFMEKRSDSVNKIDIQEIKNLIDYLNGVTTNGSKDRSRLSSL